MDVRQACDGPCAEGCCDSLGHCDVRPTTAVTGVGAHASTIAAIYMAVENLPGHLSFMRAHYRQGELVAADITRRVERGRRRGHMLILVMAGSRFGATVGRRWERDRIRQQIPPVVIVATADEMDPQKAGRSIQRGSGLETHIPNAVDRRERIWHRKRANTMAMNSGFDLACRES